MVGVGGPLGQVLASLGPRLDQMTTPATVREEDIVRLRGLAESHEARSMVVGGNAVDPGPQRIRMIQASLVHVEQARKMLAYSTCPDELRYDLYTACAWLFRAVGFSAFDAGSYPLADDLFGVAYDAALDVHNWSLAARVAGSWARLLSWWDRGVDDQHKAFGLVGQALRFDGKPTPTTPKLAFGDLDDSEEFRYRPTEFAMLHALGARIHGRLGDRRATLESIGASDAHFDAIEGGEMADRPWSGAFSRAHQQGDTGRALLDLSVKVTTTDYVEESLGRHAEAAVGHDPHLHRRSTALTYVSLAMTDVVNGAPDMAGSHGRAAMSMLYDGALDSRRLADDMRTLRDMATRAWGLEQPDSRQLIEELDVALISC